MNECGVYEFCKHHRGVLFQLTTRGQMQYLRDKLPDVDRQTLFNGLLEFKSVPAHNWEPVAQKETGIAP